MSLPVYITDFSHESTFDEVVLFYLFYFVVILYINITCDMIFVSFFDLSGLTLIKKIKLGVFLFLLGPSVIPFIMCSAISIIIIIKKKIIDYPLFVLVILLMVFLYFLPNCLGLFSGLLVPVYLMTLESNSVEKYDKVLKHRLAEHERNIEAQLAKERISRIMHKFKDS